MSGRYYKDKSSICEMTVRWKYRVELCIKKFAGSTEYTCWLNTKTSPEPEED